MNALARIVETESPPLTLDIPKGQTFEEWVSMGRQLSASSQVINWYIGDWWAAGSHRYGARAQAAAEGIFGREFGDLANIASVCRSFETSRRREHLSFTHHREACVLPPEVADRLLDKAEAEGLSTREVRRAVLAMRSPTGHRQRDVIDIRHPADVETMSADEIIVELAESLSRERALTDWESEVQERSQRRLRDVGGQVEHWSGAEEIRLVSLLREGAKVQDIAPTLERTEDAIWSRVRQLRRRGLLGALRPDGERNGGSVEAGA